MSLKKNTSDPAGKTPPSGEPDETPDSKSDPVPEIGGRDGPDPSRYGDWEHGGRCVDF